MADVPNIIGPKQTAAAVAAIHLLYTQGSRWDLSGQKIPWNLFASVNSAVRAIDRAVRSLVHLRVAHLDLGDSGATIYFTRARRISRSQAEMSPEALSLAIRQSIGEIFAFQAKRARDIASAREREDGVPVVAAAQGERPQFALETVDVANRSLSRLQGKVTPALLDVDGKTVTGKLELPGQAELVAPHKPRSERRLPGVQGACTGSHGMKGENAIIDDRASVPVRPEERVGLGEILKCNDDLVPFGKPIVRYRRQRRLPGT